MGKVGIKASLFGVIINFLLFLLKLYVGISTNSLSVYCDSINNLGDTFSCLIGLLGFYLVIKLEEKRGRRAQSLASFVIGAVVTITGAYFAYSGLERLMYPTPISYSVNYATLILLTVFVKLGMGVFYLHVNKKSPSPVIKTLALDSFMDTFVTLAAFLGFTLAEKINFAVDGIVAVIMGIAVAVTALKTVISQTKYLINN
ncbi:MAG: cation diffusion facilitator family transporter [Eubacterium sp.]